jgi:hypothetical protein
MKNLLLLGIATAFAVAPLAISPAASMEPMPSTIHGEGQARWTPPGQQRIFVTGSVNSTRERGTDVSSARGASADGMVIHSNTDLEDHSYRLGNPPDRR